MAVSCGRVLKLKVFSPSRTPGLATQKPFRANAPVTLAAVHVLVNCLRFSFIVSPPFFALAMP